MALVIVGAGGHGKVIADIAEKCGYSEIMFLDDISTDKECLGYPIVGTLKDLNDYYNNSFFVAIGNSIMREKIQSLLLEKGVKLVTLIHPSAIIGKNVSMGIGTVVMAGAVINPNTKIGNGCIINTCSSVDHDNVIEDYVHISVGAHLAGKVYVGSRTWVGIGTSISNNISVCADCMIGAGTIVIRDIVDSGTYIGVPAKKIKDTN